MGVKTSDMPILDLRQWPLKSFREINKIENVRTIVLGPEILSTYLPIPKRNVRSHLIVENHEQLLSGQMDLADILVRTTGKISLVVLGHLFIEKPIPVEELERIASIRIYGQIFYVCSDTLVALQSKCLHHQGQTLEIEPDSERWIGQRTLDLETLRRLAGKVNIVNIGTLSISELVTPEDIHRNLRKVTSIGELKGSQYNVTAFMGHCTRRLGTISLVS